MSKVVFITGCSSGIGHNLARQLTQSGYTVIATARSVESLNDLPCALKLGVDVTRPDTISPAVDRTIQAFGRIDVLVNNAGYAVRGAVEEIWMGQAQQLYDTNVLGVIRMVQAVAPHMRRKDGGRIINISSIAGKFVVPANGLYSSSKFALEALSDAMRYELAPFGICVILIEPGAIKTEFMNTLHMNSEAYISAPASPYSQLYRQCERVDADMTRSAPGPEIVSRAVQQAIETDRPKARYLVAVPFSGKLVFRLGDTAWQAVVRRLFKITTKT